MSNEEKIIEMLENLRADMDSVKAELLEIREFGRQKSPEDPPINRQLEAIDRMSCLLSDDEKARFGAFMDAEAERKAAAYGA